MTLRERLARRQPDGDRCMDCHAFEWQHRAPHPCARFVPPPAWLRQQKFNRDLTRT